MLFAQAIYGMSSAPVFAGTRIRVATVQRYLQQGYETDAILNAFPDLRVEDVGEARRQLVAVDQRDSGLITT